MILIPIANTDRDNYPCWRGASDMSGNKLKPIVYCKCGLPCGLGNHSINTEGIVNPSFYHKDMYDGDNKGCGFHEHIKLDGYEGRSFEINEGNL